MTQLPTAIETLRNYIGRTVYHNGRICQLVEVLEDRPALVLIHADEHAIQANQFGDANRRAPTTVTVPVFERDGATPHPLFTQLRLASD